MKKIVQAAYLLFAVIIMTSTMCLADEAGDKKDSLPVPEYPLSEETIDKAIEDVGLSWDAEVAEHAEVLENQTMYELYDEEARMIASLSSYTDEDGRFLMVSFMPPQLERISYGSRRKGLGSSNAFGGKIIWWSGNRRTDLSGFYFGF